MRKLKGTLKELMENAGMDAVGGNPGREDYIQAILTDRGELIDPIGTLRSVYPNVMQIVREEGERNAGRDMPGTGKSRRHKVKKRRLSI